ncbi:YciE/YciF ferroxidase family protein [Chryseobacterium jejuense]|uniref:Domain of uncharacterized function (DUF892) n=1 Tax=Chryseobacterium jejuense TaxID=445960 RepID=A0A2X2VM34_CHRJE|nr:ferritin-like domain-containing protein [Chryseobacterium jejuense]SDJ10600.1 Ferritin-like metal-binding protein YciE [Chryseobacterium jejuense]SQB27897.1 Domain of uncharacterised function (DUF892) [Chryseobacterium jejuense]
MATKNVTKKTTAKRAPAKSVPAKKTAKKNTAKGLKDLFEDGLKDIYWVEKAWVRALPKMHKNVTDKKLKLAIENHLRETEIHVKRLEECFKSLKKRAQAKKCDAMQGLLDEGKNIMKETQAGAVRDTGVIAASQKAAHYKIAAYGTLAAYAKVLKENVSLKNLLATLNEEKKYDKLLTKIADTALNTKSL